MTELTELTDTLAKVLGKRTATVVEKAIGLVTVGDLLRWYPRKYLDLGELTNIAALPMDETVSLVAKVESASVRQMRHRPGKVMEVTVTDGNGRLSLTFFNQVFKQQKELTPGRRALFSGKVSLYNGRRQLAQPMYTLLEGEDPDRATAEELIEAPYPVYPASGKITSEQLHKCIQVVLGTLPADLADPLPERLRKARDLLDLATAFRRIHEPRDRNEAEQARARLRFEEAFVLQAALARRRHQARGLTATPSRPVAGGLLDALDERLPFELTEGQVEVGAEVAADLAQSHPMHRLLQGEVGSGKTLVALRAMLTVVDNGGQAALLAPTEVLALQHHRSITAMLGALAEPGLLGGDARGTTVALLTGSLGAAARRKAMLAAASGEAGIVIGTHALLQEKVQFADLGLVVVDEQHRFGVEQRDALRAKARTVPHLLVMTATPIPRTVAMTVFGDLETSTLAQLPAGRSPITTHVVPLRDTRWMERTWARVAEEVAAGHQAYVVCPRIGEEEGLEGPLVDGAGEDDAQDAGHPDQDGEEPPDLLDDFDSGKQERRPPLAVVDVVEELRERPELRGLVVEVLHGRMPPEVREDVMRRFGAGEVHVLVATTVIEVGVDVPNATVMIVMDADRFGVSQLHQLRGRVGRGSAPGLCLLVSEFAAGPALERLQAVAATTDGFELARVDLEQRREGDVLGSKQSGTRSSLRLLRVLRDERVIAEARSAAGEVIAADPELEDHPALKDAIRNWLDTDQEAYLDRG
jgi:ATP-dependent DNA helicase RecG